MADDKTTKTPEQPVTDSGPGKETPPAPQKEPEKVSVSPEPEKKTEPMDTTVPKETSPDYGKTGKVINVLLIGQDAREGEESKNADTVILVATVYKGNIIKNLIMDCQSYTKYRPNETTGGIFVSWRRKEELPTGA